MRSRASNYGLHRRTGTLHCGVVDKSLCAQCGLCSVYLLLAVTQACPVMHFWTTFFRDHFPCTVELTKQKLALPSIYQPVCIVIYSQAHATFDPGKLCVVQYIPSLRYVGAWGRRL